MVIFYLINNSNALIRGQLKLLDARMAMKFRMHIRPAGSSFSPPASFSFADASPFLLLLLLLMERYRPRYERVLALRNETNGMANHIRRVVVVGGVVVTV